MNKPLATGIIIALVCVATAFAVLSLAHSTSPPGPSLAATPPSSEKAATPSETAPPANSDQAAISAGKDWLSLVDAADYSGSWKAAAPFFQSLVTEQNWKSSMETFRKPLGDLISRQLKSSQRMTELPGAPDGQYVVMQFDTSFSKKKTAVETVTVGLELDGKWKPSGYFIK